MVANKYAFLQITRRRFLNEWEAFKKVISRRNIRRRITIPLRSEERFSRNAETDLVCRLLLEKKKKPIHSIYPTPINSAAKIAPDRRLITASRTTTITSP